jgi:hypothetical protein
MPEPTPVNELLRRGIAAAKAGHREQAREILLSVIELDERVELAWLWLSGVVDSLEDRRICLENVLTINPDNANAQAGLRWLERQENATSLQPPSVRLSAHDEAAGAPPRGQRSEQIDAPIIKANHGWGETVRQVSGRSLPPVLAAWVNARLSPWRISFLTWIVLLFAVAGAYLWASATDVPQNPGMRWLFGQDGAKSASQRLLVGLSGAAIWLLAMGLILAKV